VLTTCDPFVKGELATLVDLICKRYPGTKPSEYLEIEDKWTAFQLDSALALKGFREDAKLQTYYVDTINYYILQVCKCLGAKGIPKKPPEYQIDKEVDTKDLRPLEQVLKELGGAGSVISY
jgi:hypothetical protein